jgi:hypothetical protein
MEFVVGISLIEEGKPHEKPVAELDLLHGCSRERKAAATATAEARMKREWRQKQ